MRRLGLEHLRGCLDQCGQAVVVGDGAIKFEALVCASNSHSASSMEPYSGLCCGGGADVPGFGTTCSQDGGEEVRVFHLH